MYRTVYTYDFASTSHTHTYIGILASGTPGFNDVVEPGIGFWIGAKAVNGLDVGIDFPYYKR